MDTGTGNVAYGRNGPTAGRRWGDANAEGHGQPRRVLQPGCEGTHTNNKSPKEIVQSLAENNIMAGAGDFYAYRPIKALGLNPDIGVVRLSFVHYTSTEEINASISALDLVL